MLNVKIFQNFAHKTSCYVRANRSKTILIIVKNITGDQAPAKAEIYAKICYEKEEKENLIQEIDVKTGNEEKKIEIKLLQKKGVNGIHSTMSNRLKKKQK